MANLGAIGEYIGNSAGAGISAGLGGIANILAMRKQKELEDKYAGQQLANMLLEKEKQTEAYKQAQAQQQGLLDTQTGLQAKLDNLNNTATMLQPLLNTQSMLSKNNTIPFGLTGGKEIANTMTNNMQEVEKQLLENKSAIGSLMNYLENPLQDYNRTLYDMAMNGNNYATQEIKDILYPKAPDWQIRTDKTYDPNTNLYKETDTAYYIDEKGNIVKGGSNTRTIGKDWTPYEIAIKNSGSGSGKENGYRFTESTMNQIYNNDIKTFEKYPGLAEALFKLNDNENYDKILPTLDILRKMPDYITKWYGSNNIEDIKKALQTDEFQYYRDKVLELSGYDIAYKPLQPIIKEIEKEGGQVYIDYNGNYVVVNADGEESIASLEDFINFE